MGTVVTLAAGALLTAAMTTASASPPAPSHSSAATHSSAPAASAAPSGLPRPVLVDCFWNHHVRPADFILACGDGNSYLTELRWSQWGADKAVAKGVNVVNDCDPYCAAGKFHGYPVTVRLDRPEPWKKNPGVEHFTRMTLTYAGARPEGFQQVMTVPLWD